MVHLAILLPREALIAGPVQSRWMYPIERYLGSLKRFVRNRACPEDSIAEGYVVRECLTFMPTYLNRIETRLNSRNFDGYEGKTKGLPVFSTRVRRSVHINPDFGFVE